MGVDIGGAHWAYGGFARFREEIAAIEGVKLRDMYGFGGWSNPDCKQIPWDTVNTPLKPLLDHSDCDGELTPEECAEVYPRLEQLISRLNDPYDREQAALLVAAMKQAIEDNEPLEFW